MKNLYIRLAEIVEEGVTKDLAETLRNPEYKLDLDEILPRLAQIRTVHQERAAELWKAQGTITDELRRESALGDLCAFFSACLTGTAAEYRETAREAVRTLGLFGEQGMIDLLARKR